LIAEKLSSPHARRYQLTVLQPSAGLYPSFTVSIRGHSPLGRVRLRLVVVPQAQRYPVAEIMPKLFDSARYAVVALKIVKAADGVAAAARPHTTPVTADNDKLELFILLPAHPSPSGKADSPITDSCCFGFVVGSVGFFHLSVARLAEYEPIRFISASCTPGVYFICSHEHKYIKRLVYLSTFGSKEYAN
jgi:hypothetical protein